MFNDSGECLFYLNNVTFYISLSEQDYNNLRSLTLHAYAWGSVLVYLIDVKHWRALKYDIYGTRNGSTYGIVHRRSDTLWRVFEFLQELAVVQFPSINKSNVAFKYGRSPYAM